SGAGDVAPVDKSKIGNGENGSSGVKHQSVTVLPVELGSVRGSASIVYNALQCEIFALHRIRLVEQPNDGLARRIVHHDGHLIAGLTDASIGDGLARVVA